MLGPVKSEHLLPMILAFAAGYVEAICYIGLFRAFTTFITGTLLILVIELVSGDPGYFTKAVILISFFIFTTVWVTLMRTWRWSLAWRTPAFLALEATLILVFMMTGTLLEPLDSSSSIDTIIVAVAAVFAMSLHSTAYFVLLKSFAASHFMTSNLTYAIVGLVDLWRSRLATESPLVSMEDAIFQAWHFPTVIVGFTVGVALGTAGFLALGFVVLIVPAIAVAGAALVSWRIEAKHAG